MISQALKRDSWGIKKTPASPLIYMIQSTAFTVDSVKRYGTNTPLIDYIAVFENSGENMLILLDDAAYIRSAKFLWENRDQLETVLQEFEGDSKELENYIDHLNSGEKHIEENFDEFMALYKRMYSSGIMVDGFLEFSESVVNTIKDKYNSESHEIIHKILELPKLSFAQREHLDLLKIALEENDTLLEEHREKFYWYLNNYKNVFGLDIKYFEKELAQLDRNTVTDEIKKLEAHAEHYEETVQRIRDQKILDETDFEDLKTLSRIAFVADRRKELNLRGNHYIGRYLKYIATQNNIPYEDLVLYTPDELGQIDSGKRIDITDRRKKMSIYAIENTFYIGTETETQETYAYINQIGSNNDGNIKGTVACEGKVTGVVKVLNFATEKTFNEGEILVASMTRPDFVPLMKKASAIVTDEGGVTSHAAIVSRELGVPCIIGTQNATRVLKDGQTVEVDANNGIVRIL